MVRPRNIPSLLIRADDISLHRIVPAQQTIARYLKKHPKSQPALIINMYIMQKTGAEESDVLQVYKQIQALAGPKKEMTGRGVWWCTLTLRNMGRCKSLIQSSHKKRELMNLQWTLLSKCTKTCTTYIQKHTNSLNSFSSILQPLGMCLLW